MSADFLQVPCPVVVVLFLVVECVEHEDGGVDLGQGERVDDGRGRDHLVLAAPGLVIRVVRGKPNLKN